MSNPPRASGDSGGDGDSSEIEKKVAKTAGIVVFSGIAMSILKAINPFNKSNESTPNLKMEPPAESTRIEKTLTLSQPPPACCKPAQQPPLQEPVFENPVSTSLEQNAVETSGKSVEIVKGDTLWGQLENMGYQLRQLRKQTGFQVTRYMPGRSSLFRNRVLVLVRRVKLKESCDLYGSAFA